MQRDYHKWFRWSIINLAIVALYGVMMRYKVLFPLPFFEQGHLLHAHSHFAFSGWISQFLYSGLIMGLSRYVSLARFKKYEWLLRLNLFCSFGMLISFTMQGYKAASIIFSTLTIVLGVAVTIMFFKDRKYLPSCQPSGLWWKAGLLFNLLASAGPLSLAYMMATKTASSQLHSGAIHFYLHFQYNGWFFFGSMAMVASCLPEKSLSLKRYFWIFVSTVVPTFFLSISLKELPAWLHVITTAATLLQLVTWVRLLKKLFPLINHKKVSLSLRWINWIFYTSASAFTVKLMLQTISIVPSVSELVFNFRSVAIAYLHLVLLGAYSLFFIGFLLTQNTIRPSATVKTFACCFLGAVVLNELGLAIQACSPFINLFISLTNEVLLASAVLLLLSTTGLALTLFKQQNFFKQSSLYAI